MICLKKAKTITMIGIIVVTALLLLIASFPNVVNASQDSSVASTENKISKKERKEKFENLTDEEKEALKNKKGGIKNEYINYWRWI